MSDEANAGGASAGEETAVAGAQGGAETGADGVRATETGGTLAALAEDGGVAAPADWPEDWRERLAGTDESSMALLKRIGSPGDLFKKVLAQEQTIRRGAHKAAPALPENATEEQVAEYRKVLGVPETPDGYGVKFAPEIADDGLNAMLGNYLAFAHEQNLPPDVVKKNVAWQEQVLLQQREEQAAAAARERARVTQELRKQYGAEYRKNLALADEFLAGRPGLDALVKSAGPNLELVRDIIALARATAPEDVLHSGDGASGGKSLNEEKDGLVDKSIRGKLTRAEDARLNHLYEVLAARDARLTRVA